MKVTNQGLVSTEETNSNLSEVDFENKGQNKQHGGKRPRVSNLFLQAEEEDQENENYVTTTEGCELSSQRMMFNQNETNIPNETVIHSRLSYKQAPYVAKNLVIEIPEVYTQSDEQ